MAIHVHRTWNLLGLLALTTDFGDQLSQIRKVYYTMPEFTVKPCTEALIRMVSVR